ncbi:peptidase M48 family protein [Hydrogenophaga sp. RAC07]|uniref:M48 family metalloprotease n=1 Tax=Hydrogenophaga sp. RAC07 TaxID=1842537 RepID=UPI0008556E38|nr:M48 family metalloprotease [Hydrogenophaga sp. RAC07]AOF86528.1 peptidase M48 family protein [Hydrogenophaga sp. RAC07]
MNSMVRFFQIIGLSFAGLLASAPAMAQGACVNEPGRAHELRVLDEIQITELMERFDVVAAPQRLHTMLASLVAAAPRLRQGPAVHLLAYEDKDLNAYAADHGMVILTSAMWSKQEDLSDDELAAVMAHELAHIEGRDSLVEACANLQRLKQPAMRFEDARDRMALEMFNPRSTLARQAQQQLHAQEHAADVRAIALLRAVGRNPQAMVSVLAKIHGTTPSALNLLMGTTHPELRARLEKAQAAVDAVNAGQLPQSPK